eukprot:TRINITY_DN8630_c1_g1_i1.p1 TRINITY_DN8630_c1_g1~~TRINITY_DN8630_c1_g1_i1.p1  ORF type:complete len:530 (-),score=87.81 TRINITY_DN8630_c1_g1_i1:109-1614(-)
MQSAVVNSLYVTLFITVLASRPAMTLINCDYTTGHAYELVTIDRTWDDARLYALNSTYQNCSGYLVTITSSAEWQFVQTLLTAPSLVVWTGGISYELGTFVWADGPELNQTFSIGIWPDRNCTDYCAWCDGEPNNAFYGYSFMKEQVVELWQPPTGYCANDAVRTSPTNYMIEYGQPSCLPCLIPTETTSSLSSSLTPVIPLSLSPSLNSASISSSPSSPSSTSKPLDKPASPIVINKQCSKSTASPCPSNNHCEDDPSKCKGSPSIDQPIQETSFKITSKYKDRPVQINAIHTGDGSFAFQFDFAPNALLPGWTVSISTGNTSRTIDDEDECHSSGVQILSPAVQLTVVDENGDQVRHFEVPLNITTFAYPFKALGSSHYEKGDDVCFGYNHKAGDPWQCSEEFESQSTKTKNVAWTKTSSNHLTSFAVLLRSSGDSCDGLDWISIASISIIASSICLVFSCALLYSWSVKFRALVGGYKTNQKLSEIQKNVINKQTAAD